MSYSEKKKQLLKEIEEKKNVTVCIILENIWVKGQEKREWCWNEEN